MSVKSKYIAIAIKQGIWIQLSKPCSLKDAKSLEGCQCSGEIFKVVSEAKFNKHAKTL